MPIAGPPTAATTGFFIHGSTSNRALAGGTPPEGRLRKSATSLPAVKHSAVPCSRTARTAASASAAARAAPSCAYICAVRAFFLSTRSKHTRATRSFTSLLIKAVVLELLAQRELGELARGGVRQLRHEQDIVRHPPLGDLALVEAQQLFARNLLPGLLHHHHDRPLVPLRVLDADHRRLRDRRVRDRDVLQVDRADPLAAGLDHVLRAIGDLHVALGVERGHVAGGKPAVLQRIPALPPLIATGPPARPHLSRARA